MDSTCRLFSNQAELDDFVKEATLCASLYHRCRLCKSALKTLPYHFAWLRDQPVCRCKPGDTAYVLHWLVA